MLYLIQHLKKKAESLHGTNRLIIPQNTVNHRCPGVIQLECVQVRSSNNNARAYSNTIVVKDLTSPVLITPKKSAVVIPLQ
jgi:hypothetical protein